MAFCPYCGRPISEQSSSCPNCLKAQPNFMAAAPAAHPLYSLTVMSPPMLADHMLLNDMAGFFASFVFPTLLFLASRPYNRNLFVRFHSFQCLFSLVALALLGFVLAIVTGLVVSVVPEGTLIGLLWLFCGIAVLAVWLLLAAHAYQHEVFKLPVVGKLAQKQAGV